MNQLTQIPDILSIKKEFINNISHADFDNLPISDYSKVYLKNIQSQVEYITDIYSTIVLKGISVAEKKIDSICMIDYGGGVGLLSVFAKMCGVQKVVYNDIYNVSCSDVVHISKELKTNLDDIIEGDIDMVMKYYFAKADMIVSMDVLEHIYDLDNFFSVSSKINPSLVMVHYTGANADNLWINYRLKQQHKKVEYKGITKEYGHKESDSVKPFLEIRKEMIQQNFPSIDEPDLSKYAKLTRGLFKEDILSVVSSKRKSNGFEFSPLAHPTNTCDPYTGNWEERLLKINQYKKLGREHGFHLEVTPALYNTKQHLAKSIPLSILNKITQLFNTIRTAPGFYLVFKHNK